MIWVAAVSHRAREKMEAALKGIKGLRFICGPYTDLMRCW